MKRMVSILLSAMVFFTLAMPAIAGENAPTTMSAREIMAKSVETMKQLESFKSESSYIVSKNDGNVEIQRLVERDKTNSSRHGQTCKNGKNVRESYVQDGYAYWMKPKTGEFVKVKLNMNGERATRIAENLKNAHQLAFNMTTFVLDSELTNSTHYVIHGTGTLEEDIKTSLESNGVNLPDKVAASTRYVFYVQKDTFYPDRIEMTANISGEDGKTLAVTGITTVGGFNQTSITVPEEILSAPERTLTK